MNKYKIPVNFTTTITVDVEAHDPEDAKHEAEYQASVIFSSLMMENSLYYADFVAEAQEV